MDEFQVRALKNQQARHETKIRESAERISEYIGYVLGRLDRGSFTTVGHYANDIAGDAREIGRRLAVLESIEDTIAIFEVSSDRESQ